MFDKVLSNEFVKRLTLLGGGFVVFAGFAAWWLVDKELATDGDQGLIPLAALAGLFALMALILMGYLAAEDGNLRVQRDQTVLEKFDPNDPDSIESIKKLYGLPGYQGPIILGISPVTEVIGGSGAAQGGAGAVQLNAGFAPEEYVRDVESCLELDPNDLPSDTEARQTFVQGRAFSLLNSLGYASTPQQPVRTVTRYEITRL